MRASAPGESMLHRRRVRARGRDEPEQHMPNLQSPGDGDACTQTDTCHAGTCTGSNPVACAPKDACHVGGACNPITGACTNPAAANGTDCGANQLCNTGACVPTATTCPTGQSICKGI